MAVDTVELFGVHLARIRFDEALDWVFARGGERRVRTVAFPSLNPIFMANLEQEFHGLYDGFDLVLNDGRNVARFVRLLGDQLAEPRIAGMDFLPQVARRAGRDGRSIYVVAPSEAIYLRLVARAAAELGCPGDRFVGHAVPPFRQTFVVADLRSVVADIDRVRPDLVWVGIASPKQETIGRVLKQELNLATPTILCVGGAMETTAGVVPIGPDWVRKAGLESFYRAWRDPRKHARRYLGYNLVVVWFAARALAERLRRVRRGGIREDGNGT